MRQLTAIYDIGLIKDEFLGSVFENLSSFAFWDRHKAEGMFYAWLVESLENLYCIVPDNETISKANLYRTQPLRVDWLLEPLYNTVQVPSFTGNYRCHVLLIRDDLFLIFN